MGSDAYFSGQPGVLSTQKIQSGSFQMTTNASGNIGGNGVFPVAFSTTPVVVLSWTTGSGSAIGYVQLALPPTTTGFSANVQSGNGNTLYTIYWIAVGT